MPNVSLSALVKGRSPSYGLRPALRRAGATLVAGCIYPSYHFGPTRILPADHPTGDASVPDPGPSILRGGESEQALFDLMQVAGLKRHQSNWARLCLLILQGLPPWVGSRESWRIIRPAVATCVWEEFHQVSGILTLQLVTLKRAQAFPMRPSVPSTTCTTFQPLHFGALLTPALWILATMDCDHSSLPGLGLLLVSVLACLSGLIIPGSSFVGMEFARKDSPTTAQVGPASSLISPSVGPPRFGSFS